MSFHIRRWDAEFESIAGDLLAVKQYQADSMQKERLALVSLKMGIFQTQGQLAQVLEKIKASAPRQSMLPPKFQSLIRWANNYAELAGSYYFARVHLLGKSMWLRLIHSRTPGTSVEPGTEFTDENLIELSLRLKQLQDTHRYLEQRLVQLRDEQKNLHHRYEDCLAIHANREAAATLTASFGRNLSEARQHPLMRRLSSLFQHFSQAVQPLTQRYSYLTELHREVVAQTDAVIQHCKSLVLSDIKNPQTRSQRNMQREFDASLRQIEDLRKQLDIAKDLCSPSIPSAHPILLQKQIRKAKNI